METKKPMKQSLLAFLLLIGLLSCESQNNLVQLGEHYRMNRDYASLAAVVDLVKIGTDTASIKYILGDPIDFGFDYRYLIDSLGPNGCVIGAVFHIDDQGKIDQKWIDEICE